MGTPLKLDDQLAERFCDYLKAGLSYDDAASACSITRQSVANWVKRGRQDDAVEPFRSFALKVEQARASYRAALVQRINKGADTDWKAAAWMLERHAPKSYGRQREDTSPTNTTVVALVQETGLSAEVIREAMELGRIPPEAIGRHPTGRRYIADMDLAKRALLGEVVAEGTTTASSQQPAPIASLERARIERQQALAEKAKLDVEQRRGLLVRREDAQREVNEALVSFREALTQLPPRLAHELANLSDAQAIERVLDTELRRVLNTLYTELSDGDAQATV